jgi:hypothetical protein
MIILFNPNTGFAGALRIEQDTVSTKGQGVRTLPGRRRRRLRSLSAPRWPRPLLRSHLHA